MTALLRLYPRPWRDRYEAEVIALLAADPPSLGDRVDIVRGALDARLHPQVPASGDPDPGGLTVMGRNAGYLAIVGGALWVIAALAIATAPDLNAVGVPEIAVVGVALGALLFGIAAWVGATERQSRWTVARVATVAMVLSAILVALPWPIFIAGMFGIAIGGATFGLATAIHTRSVATLLVAVASVGFIVGGVGLLPPEYGILPLGIAWIVAGVTRVAGRRSFAWA